MGQFVLGEFRRAIDDRFRLSLPNELLESLLGETANASTLVLAKERPGALSLWRPSDWNARLTKDVELVQSKLDAGHLRARTTDLQKLGRLLSTRHRDVQIAGRGRLVIPESFREFLGVEGGGDVMIVGAAVCIEIWRTTAWLTCLEEEIPQFGNLLDQLAG